MASDEAVELAAVNDAAQAAAMPKLSIPEGHEDTTFVVPDLPTVPFSLRRLEDGVEFGPFAPEGWVTDDETNFTTGHDEDGRLVVLRVYWQERKGSLQMLMCVTDEGQNVTYIVREMPDNTLEDPELPTTGPTNDTLDLGREG